MSLSSFIYLIDVLSSFNSLCTLIIFLGGLGLAIGLILFNIFLFQPYNSEDEEKFYLSSINKLKKLLIPYFIVCIITFFIPSTKTMYLMIGSNYLQNSTIPPKIMAALELKLDDVIENLKKDKKG